MINQERAILGQSPIGPLNPHLYPLSGTSNFRKITSGNNDTIRSNGFSANSTGTYNECTGLGVRSCRALVETLAGTGTLTGPSQAVTNGENFVTVNQGRTTGFSVNVAGMPLTYQWQRMAVGTTGWANLSDNATYTGSASATLQVADATTAMSGDQFQCVVNYGSGGTVTSPQPIVLVVETPWTVGTIAGQAGTSTLTNGTGTAALFDYPTDVVADSTGNLYVADEMNNVIRKLTFTGTTTTVTTPYGEITNAPPNNFGSSNGNGNSASFNAPRDLAIDSSNNLYVSDLGNNLIRKIVTTGGSAGTVSTFCSSTLLNLPRGIGLDSSGNVYVADSGNNVVLKITPSGSASIFAGSGTFTPGYHDATGTLALFNQPLGLTVDKNNNVYVLDYNNFVVRKITPAGVVTTVAGQAGVPGCLDGTGTQTLFNLPRGITSDSAGNLYVTDSLAPAISQNEPIFSGNNLLRKITPAGVVTTLAGQAGIAGSNDAGGSGAQFYNSCGLTMTSSGTLYIADAGNNTIRSAIAEAAPAIAITATLPAASFAAGADGQFTVTRTGDMSSNLNVNYSVAGTAIAGTDYTALTGSLTIATGATTGTITVIPLFHSAATANTTVQANITSTSETGVVTINSTPATVTLVEAQPVGFANWEASFPNPITSDPSAIPENDGTTNLLKYVTDINPGAPMTASDRDHLPVVGMATTGTTTYLTLTYQELAGLTGTTINLQTSPTCRPGPP